MAEPIEHQVTPPRIGPDAHEELEKLLQTLHEHGVLRFANDIVGANQSVTQVLVDGLNKEGSLNAIQNLSALLMALSTIPPEQYYKVLFALKDSVQYLSDHQRTTKDDGAGRDGDKEAPGIKGAYQLLHDEELWQAITPILESLKVFADRMNRDIDKPITDFTGKSSSA